MRISDSNAAPYDDDLAYIQDRVYSQFAEQAVRQIVETLRVLPAPDFTVMDIGCGAGNSTRVLIDAGFRVIAVDPSAALLEIAHKKAPEATFINASAYDVELPSCDAVIAIGEPLTYHQSGSDAKARLRHFFRAVHAALPPKGMLIFDLIVTGQEILARKTWSAGDDWAILVQITEDQDSNNLKREITTFRKHGKGYRRSQERHSVRVFDDHEIALLLDEIGFDTQMDSKYGSVELLTRRRAFFAARQL